MPSDWAARAELFRLLGEAGRAGEARFVARASELLRRLETGDDAELELGLRELAGMSALVEPAIAATAGQGRERFPCLDLLPFSLHYRAETLSTAPIWDYKPLLPFRVLVVGDFSGTPLPRPLQDVHPTRVTRESFQAVRTQVAGNATRDVSSDWRALWWLLEQVGGAAQIDLLPCSLAELREDFADSPQVSRSGLRWILRSKNHLGMDPYGLVVLSDFVDPSTPHDQALLTQLAAVGLGALVPVVAGARVRREAPLLLNVGFDGAPYLALCAEPFTLSGQDAAPLNGSFLAASLICDRFASNAWGGPLRGQVSGWSSVTKRPGKSQQNPAC